MKSAPAAATVTSLSDTLLSWLGVGGDGGAPAAAPLAWTALAVSRRELGGGSSGTAKAASSTTSGLLLNSPSASAVTADQFRLFGDGTADNPNAGLLGGTGYTYTSYEGACTTGGCDGGKAGLLWGSAGDGFNGGAGGAAGCSSAAAVTAGPAGRPAHAPGSAARAVSAATPGCSPSPDIPRG